MLRRAAWVLRVLLLVLGAAVLLWLPVSFLLIAAVSLPFPKQASSIDSTRGRLTVSVLQQGALEVPFEVQVLRARIGTPLDRSLALRPQVLRVNQPGWRATTVHVPLWLLAFLCLAWPVTSL